MLVQAILLPLFVLVLLVFAVGILMAKRRRDAFMAGTHFRDIALREPNWPKAALQAQYAYANLFEMPVLFYVAVIIAILTKHADTVMVVLAWIYVAFRYLQAYVHVTSNQVKYRGMYFLVSTLVLMVMWAWLVIGIFVAPPVVS